MSDTSNQEEQPAEGTPEEQPAEGTPEEETTPPAAATDQEVSAAETGDADLSAQQATTAEQTEGQTETLEATEGGITTRDDATDLGVPMIAGDPNEPVGPEDALGQGSKRGDYSNRLGETNYQPHQVVPVVDPQPGEPLVEVIEQAPLASIQGDEAGEKGGVTTTA